MKTINIYAVDKSKIVRISEDVSNEIHDTEFCLLCRTLNFVIVMRKLTERIFIVFGNVNFSFKYIYEKWLKNTRASSKLYFCISWNVRHGTSSFFPYSRTDYRSNKSSDRKRHETRKRNENVKRDKRTFKNIITQNTTLKEIMLKRLNVKQNKKEV